MRKWEGREAVPLTCADRCRPDGDVCVHEAVSPCRPDMRDAKEGRKRVVSSATEKWEGRKKEL